MINWNWLREKIFMYDLNCRLKYLGANASFHSIDRDVLGQTCYTVQVNAGGNFAHVLVAGLHTKNEREYWLKKIYDETRMKKTIETASTGVKL